MNIKTARKIAKEVMKLTENVSKYQAKYGRHYELNDDSPEEAKELKYNITMSQRKIARLLDTKALESPFSRYGAWWERLNVIDTATVNALVNEVFRLINACATVNSKDEVVDSYSVQTIQSSIAGMLHPNARQETV